ncbi:MAG: hypothetical protein ABIN36_19700 [Ferruginibacter sp.]
MHKLIILAVFFIVFQPTAHAQTILDKGKGAYEYYIRITGINSREQVTNIQDLISTKPGVISFTANRYPVRYFLLRSSQQIGANEFQHLLNNTALRIELYAEGNKGKEQAILLYNMKPV